MENLSVKKIDSSKSPNDGSFLQTPFWCSFKARHGWNYSRFEIQNQEAAVLSRSFCRNLFTIAYVPLFPVFNSLFTQENFSEASEENFCRELENFAFLLKPFLPKNTIAVRFDPKLEFDSPENRQMYNSKIIEGAAKNKYRVVKNTVDIQPPDTTLVDLSGTEEDVMNRMHSKWRYNIRLAERKGVEIKKYNGSSPEINEKIDVFYKLTKETNARDGNSSHAKSYYLDLIKYSSQMNESETDESGNKTEAPEVNLYIASHENEEIAAIMTLFSRTESIYLYGASSNRKRNLMPNHLLQWTAMKDAKAYGSIYYDMYGMSPEGKNENHPMHGLYMFKVNFGGKNVHRTGSWDIPFSFVYNLYRTAEKARAFWFKKVMKKIRNR